MRGAEVDFVHPCYDVFPDPLGPFTSDWVRAVRATGAGVICWNTLDVAVARTVFRLGADGVCSDDPGVLVEAVASLD